MSRMDDVRAEDSRDKAIDREPEREEKLNEREKVVNRAIDEICKDKEDTKAAILVEHVVRNIEKDTVKPDEFKELQYSLMADQLKDAKDGNSVSQIQALEKSSELETYRCMMTDERSADERQTAENLIESILNDRDIGRQEERTAACISVMDMYERGDLRGRDVSDDKEKTKLIESAREDGNVRLENIRLENIRDIDRTKEVLPERSDAERVIREKEVVKNISEIAPFVREHNALDLQMAIRDIERNPDVDDKFKDLQESFLTAYLKDKGTYENMYHSETGSIADGDERYMPFNSLVERSFKDAFECMSMDYCADGKMSPKAAEDILKEADTRGDQDKRTEILSKVIEKIDKGELKDEKDAKTILDTAERDIDKDMDRPDKDEGIRELADKTAKEVTEALNISDERSEKNIKEVVMEICSTNLHDDSLRRDIVEKGQELLKENTQGQALLNSDVRAAFASAERQVIIEKITEGKDTLSLSQERAVSYVEKYMDRDDLSAKEKTANAAAVLDAYKNGLIPEKEDLSKRAERSVVHNIEMDAKDRMTVLNAEERLVNTGRIKGVEIDKKDNVLNHGVMNIERSMLSDDLKEKQKEIFADLIEKDRNEGKAVDSREYVERNVELAERQVIVDKLTHNTGSISEKNVEHAVNIIENLSQYKNDDGRSLSTEERTAAVQAVINMSERGEIPKDDKLGDNDRDKFVSKAVRESGKIINERNEREEKDKELILSKNGRDIPDKTEKKDNKPDDRQPEKDEKKPVKEQRPIGVDPEKDAKEEARNSKRVWYEEAKDIWEKSAEIYERKVLSANHNTDTTLSQTERDIVERSIKLRQEQVDKNNAEKAAIIDKNVKLQKSGQEIPKDSIERLGKLEKYNAASEREIFKMKQMVDPEYIRAKDLTRLVGTSVEKTKKDLEEKTVYPDPSDKRLFHFREEALHWRNHPGIMERVTYEACIYSALTGRRPSSVAGKDITTFEARNKSLPSISYIKLMEECRHSEGARMYLEIFKVDGRKAKPLEINNVCAVLDRINKSPIDEKTKELQRIALGEMCRDRKIANAKQNDEYRNKLYEKTAAIARDKRLVKDPVKEGIEREARKETLRDSLTKVPEKTDREIVKYVLNAKEKVDVQALLEMSRDVKEELKEKAPVDANGNKEPVKMESYSLSKQELRRIVCGPNPEALSMLDNLRVKMPDGVELNGPMYDRAVEVIRGTNEQNDVVKMAMVNFALSKDGSYKGLDGEEGRRLDAIEKNSRLLVKSLADMSAKHELVKVIRKDLRENIKAEREEQREQARKELRAIDYDRAPERVLKDTSRHIGNLCRSDDYSREKLQDKLTEVREGMKYHREILREDFKSIRTKDRGLKPNDAIAVVEKDPRMLLPIQRAGISIGMNGLINEERLQETIMKMETIPHENTVLRMAALEKNFISHKNNSMDLKNAINMGNREDTRDVNNMALWMYAREHNLNFRMPVDDREKAALDKNIADLRRYEAKERVEKAFISQIRSLGDGKDLDRPETFVNVSKDLSSVAALAVQPDYEEKLKDIIEGLKTMPDADRDDVKSSIQVLETLSRFSESRPADTANDRTVLNRTYDETGKAVDINLEARFVAISAVEKMTGVEQSVLDKAAITRLNRHNVTAQYEEMRNTIDEKSKRISIPFKDHLPTPAQADSIREYINRDGFGSKLKLNTREDAANDAKVNFLIDIGLGKEIGAGRDENGISYLYSADNLDKIDSLYSNAYEKVSVLRNNYSPDGNPSIEDKRNHLVNLSSIEKEAEKACRDYQYVRDEAVVGAGKLTSMMIDFTREDSVTRSEEGLRGMPMYNGAYNVAILSDGSRVDRMLFARNRSIYDMPIDKVRPSIETEPCAISADDARTIMNNREHIVDCGINYNLTYSDGIGNPVLSMSGLNDISVSNLSDKVYLAVTRSLAPEDFKNVSDMRHDKELYKAAKDGATVYQKYYADFGRDVAKSPDSYERHVDIVYEYMKTIHESREAVQNVAARDDVEEKTSAFIAIEYSRQQLYAMVPSDIIDTAFGRWQEEFQQSALTMEHAEKMHFDRLDAPTQEEQTELSPMDTAMELSQRLGYDFDDIFSFMEAHDNGLITDEEFERASAVYTTDGSDYFDGPATIETPLDDYDFMGYNGGDDFSRDMDAQPNQDFGQDPNPDFGPQPQDDGFNDYYDRQDDVRDAYTDSESFTNTPFAGLFDGLNLDYDREEAPVLGEDEMDFDMNTNFDEGAAYFEEDYERFMFEEHGMTPEEIEMYEETERMNLEQNGM